jgi:bifunctional non-homologous end joining protein LigD
MPGRKNAFIHPMLAREVSEPFSDEHWLYEVKWDGYRAIAELKGEAVRLYSRSGRSFNEDYPDIVAELRALRMDAVFDGEIVVLDRAGNSRLHLLEQYDGRWPLRFQVFDLLFKDGHCLEKQPLLWRKQLLKTILPPGNRVRYNDHVRGNGIGLFKEAMAGDREGIMGKRADSVYSEGKRSADWLKIKTHREAEAVIIGMADGTLLLGRYEEDRLCFAGQVEKGPDFPEDALRALVRKTPPIKGWAAGQGGVSGQAITWLKPSLVCTIRYSALTGEGVFRDALFRGWRQDKQAREAH